MDVDTARGQVAELVQEIGELQTVATESMRRAQALRKVVGGLVEAYPELVQLAEPLLHLGVGEDPDPGRADSAPRGAEAVRFILQEQPGVWFLVSELVTELRDRVLASRFGQPRQRCSRGPGTSPD